MRHWISAPCILALMACSAGKEGAEPLYVSLERGDAVAVVDPASGTVIHRIAAGKRPRGLIISPDGTRLYVAVSGSPIGGPNVDESKLPPPDRGSDGIAVIGLPGGKVERVLAAGNDPETFALSPDGQTIYVSNEDTGTVTAVSTQGAGPNRSTKVGKEPEGVAITPDGAHLFVACEESDYVAMLDAHTMALVKTVPIAGRPRSIVISADGKSAYVTVEIAGRLDILSAADGSVVRQIDLARGDKAVRPMGIVEGPGGHLFVTTGRDGAVLEVDPAAGTIVRRVAAVGARPWGIGMTADQRWLATANGPSGDIALIDRATGKIDKTIKVGEGPWGIAHKVGAAR